MWIYEKRLQFPVKITQTCPKTASLIISQFGGPDGELANAIIPIQLNRIFQNPLQQPVYLTFR